MGHNKARTREAGIACQVYWPEGKSGFSNSMIFLDGMPYIPECTPMMDYAVTHGWGAIEPQYFGTFDSDREFSPLAAVETVLALPEMLSRGSLWDFRGERDLEVGSSPQFVASHSFGTNVLFSAILAGFRPRLAVFLSPYFLFGSNGHVAGQRGQLDGQVRHVAGALPHTFRLSSKDDWMEFFFSGAQERPDPESVDGGKRTRILCAVGSEDSGIDSRKSRDYIEEFASRCPAIELVEYVVVQGAGHDQAGLMSERFLALLDQELTALGVDQD